MPTLRQVLFRRFQHRMKRSDEKFPQWIDEDGLGHLPRESNELVWSGDCRLCAACEKVVCTQAAATTSARTENCQLIVKFVDSMQVYCPAVPRTAFAFFFSTEMKWCSWIRINAYHVTSHSVRSVNTRESHSLACGHSSWWDEPIKK